MGLLDKQTRFVDAVLTAHGRSQLAAGGLRIAFCSLDDSAVGYSPDGESYGDPCVVLEAPLSLPRDELVPEIDEDGVVANVTSGSVQLQLGQASSGSSALDVSLALDPQRAFEQSCFIGETSTLDGSEFELGPASVSFSLTDATLPARDAVLDVDVADSMWTDAHFAGVINYASLPPIAPDGTKLADYVDSTPADGIALELERCLLAGKRIRMSPRPRGNRIALQFYATSPTGARKLHVVDCGVRAGRRLLAVGRLLRDSAGEPVFVRLFAAALER